MRTTALIPLIAALPLMAQYGTFNAKMVSAAKSQTTLVVLDDTKNNYNPALMDAVKADWKFGQGFDFINLSDLVTQPLDPAKNYLMRISRKDPEKHEAVFLALVAGWKQKRDEALLVEDGTVKNIPPTQELASIMLDIKDVTGDGSIMLAIYVKHLQDYLKLVEGGKITDKATADRVYASRTRLIKEKTLYLDAGDLDKTLPDAEKARETYKGQLEVVPAEKLLAILQSGDASAAIGDVVITGEHKTKWCFKRVFDANTGELLFLRDDAALYGKKEGFISEDMRMIEQSR